MNNLYKIISEELKQGRSFCLATIISSLNSCPQKIGSFFIIRFDGSIFGTIGGGELEAKVIKAGVEAQRYVEAKLLHFRLRPGDHLSGSQMICGGDIYVYLEPIIAEDQTAFNIFIAAAQVIACREKAVLVTNILPGFCPSLSGRCFLLTEKRGIIGNFVHFSKFIKKLGNDFSNFFEFSYLLTIDSMEHDSEIKLFFNPIIKQPVVYIFGGGHISLFLANLIKNIGFQLVIFDDRPEYANYIRYPCADEIRVIDFQLGFKDYKLEPDSYVIIITRGHIYDIEVLSYVLTQNITYVGMIGSYYKRERFYNILKQKGVTYNQLLSIHAPIGLDIGAVIPEEIAVSIAAELVAVKSKKYNILSN